jgi:hypothetical protein
MRKLARSSGNSEALQIVGPPNMIVYESFFVGPQSAEAFICEEGEKQLVLLKDVLKWLRRK